MFFTSMAELSLGDTWLYIVPCGAGTFYNIEQDHCTLCQPGRYQHEQAQLECEICPPGTATVFPGATGLDQCQGAIQCTRVRSIGILSLLEKFPSYERVHFVTGNLTSSPLRLPVEKK